MKDDVVLINTSRGEIIHLPSLIKVCLLHLYNKALRSYIYIFVCIYVSYSWPNGWAKCAEFFSKIDFLSDGVNL